MSQPSEVLSPVSGAKKDVFSSKDAAQVRERYSERYHAHGYSPLTLGWNKGRQAIRFDALTSEFNINGKHVLDIGCGFGDLNKTLLQEASSYSYTGIDLVSSLLEEGRLRFPGDHIRFIEANIMDFEPQDTFDYAIASGVFNHKLSKESNYLFIEQVIVKALNMCKTGLAFDFLSDKVDYQLEHTFHSSPEKILEIAYKHSRNVILKNHYMPFEFSLFIFKDDSFSSDDAVFNEYKKKQ